MVRILMDLMKENTSFNWSSLCQVSFDTIKIPLTNSLILIFPDPYQPYVFFTDASKHSWFEVLIQERVTNIKDKNVKSFL